MEGANLTFIFFDGANLSSFPSGDAGDREEEAQTDQVHLEPLQREKSKQPLLRHLAITLHKSTGNSIPTKAKQNEIADIFLKVVDITYTP